MRLRGNTEFIFLHAMSPRRIKFHMNRDQQKPTIVHAVQITDHTFDAPHPNPEHVAGILYDPVQRIVSVCGSAADSPIGQVGDFIVRYEDGSVDIVSRDVYTRLSQSAA
jgi:hypothetical protein